jgi:putative tricarboxylic transport membrane protein
MIDTAFTDLWYGFGVALEPHNLLWCFIGVLVGNMVGVLPGMGPVATISILLPLTFGMKPVAAILMLSGVYYGAQYGGAICSILLNLPCHPPHAVTCLDGYPLTKQGKGGTALGVTVISSFVGASFGITEMIFLAPALVKIGGNLFADAARSAGRFDAGARLAAQRRHHDGARPDHRHRRLRHRDRHAAPDLRLRAAL